MAVVSEPPWVNHSSGTSARNGTVTHVIPFGFTSTTGNELVFLVHGAVTHTNAGWNERVAPLSSGELSVFTKTSAGESSFTDTCNGSNYPVAWAVYELPTGSTWVNGAGSSPTTAVTTITTVGSLPGTEVVCWAARGQTDASGATTPPVCSATWPSPWVEDFDQHITRGSAQPTDGTHLIVGRQNNITATTSPTGTVAVTNATNTTDVQWVAFAMTVAALAADVDATATAASGSGASANAVVSVSKSVTAQAATATGAATNAVASTAVTERFAPDAILAQTGLTGAVTAIQDDPDSPDGSWLVSA